MASFALVSDVRSSAGDPNTHATANLFRNLSDAQLLTKLTAASARLERKIGRRLAPFTRTSASHRAYALQSDALTDARTVELKAIGALRYGDYVPGNAPIFSLGPPLSFWIDETPGEIDEGWTLTVSAMSVQGGDQRVYAVDLSTVGTDPHTGLVWFTRPNIFVNDGCRVTVTYAAGFSGAVPGDLVEATIQEAAYTQLIAVNQSDGGSDAADFRAFVEDVVATWSLDDSKRGGQLA